ncbi:MAG: PHP domain-containing protein [Verrucomicrobia bacterium]|nr:PHP domain-containing protein [Verrucomicrobiota bacterium]MBI3866950.1 PHP domain-containing protein [Verrucomicrobiota bacterium]
MYADLHLHTRFSDGTYSPEELAQKAADHQLKAIALTDHDTVEGCAPTARACEALQVEFIPGCEFTAAAPSGMELHVLGYFLDTRNELLLRELAHYQDVRQDRVRRMVAKLNDLGVALPESAVFELAGCRAPGRPHVARALVQAGLCATSDQAFDLYLKMNRPAWVPKEKMALKHAIGVIHGAGGVAVMAHPILNRCDDLIPSFVEMGLDGLECYHSRQSGVDSDRYRRMADQLGILVSGGSDCHGMNKGRPLIGGVKLPYSFVERLRERHQLIRDTLPAQGGDPVNS